MHLVDDVDLEPPLRRRVAHGLAQLAHLLDAVVRGAVNLDHVEAGAVGDGLADGIFRIKVRLGSGAAVEGLGEDPRHAGLASAPRADE